MSRPVRNHRRHREPQNRRTGDDVLSLPAPSVTYLSSRGYAIDLAGNDVLVQYLRDLCTVKPVVNPNAPGAELAKPFPVYRESSKKLYVPRALGLKLMGVPRSDTLHAGRACEAGLCFAGKLRPEQEGIVAAFLSAARDPAKQGGIISVGCGFGKTTMALYIAAALGRKTLVICHKDFLINQWRERIAQYLPSARVGLIKAKTLDVLDKDIVLASLQSLAMKDYDRCVFEEFGFVAIDEVHHTSAEVFSRALPKITARVMLGLSATLDRKDGLRKVFEWHLGSIVHDPVARQDTDMIVEMLQYDAADLTEVHMFNGKLNTAAMLNAVCAHPERNRLLMDRLEALLRKDPGRRTLILSDRRAHLKELEAMIAARGLGSVGYYVGGMKEEALNQSAACDIILGTNMMAAEGMDIPVLNTLVLASPVSSVEQQLGRIQRQKPCDRVYIPYTLDVWDNFSIFKNQGVRRRAFYKKKGYQVKVNNIEQDIEEEEDRMSVPPLPPYAFIDA